MTDAAHHARRYKHNILGIILIIFRTILTNYPDDTLIIQVTAAICFYSKLKLIVYTFYCALLLFLVKRFISGNDKFCRKLFNRKNIYRLGNVLWYLILFNEQ